MATVNRAEEMSVAPRLPSLENIYWYKLELGDIFEDACRNYMGNKDNEILNPLIKGIRKAISWVSYGDGDTSVTQKKRVNELARSAFDFAVRDIPEESGNQQRRVAWNILKDLERIALRMQRIEPINLLPYINTFGEFVSSL